MKLSEWKSKLKEHQVSCDSAKKIYEDALISRNKFLFETVGIQPNTQATVEGTCGMVEKMLKMKEEDN